MVDGIMPPHPRRTSGADIPNLNSRADLSNEKHVHALPPPLHSRQGSNFMKREDEEEDSEMAEVDEIENDMDS